MTIIRSEVRPGAYFDSAVLMRLQRALAGLPGVEDAGVVMATAANCELLEQSGLLTPAAQQASANDLLIVVRAADGERGVRVPAEEPGHSGEAIARGRLGADLRAGAVRRWRGAPGAGARAARVPL